MVENGIHNIQTGYMTPEVIIPQKLVGTPEITYAESLDELPPALVAILQENAEEYISIPIQYIPAVYAQYVENMRILTPDEEVSVRANGLLLIPSESAAEPGKLPRKLERQGQRLQQFGRLLEQIDRLEMEFDEEMSPFEEYKKRRLLAKYNKIANSWYRDELAGEMMTRKAGQDRFAERVIHPEELIKSVVQHLQQLVPEPLPSTEVLVNAVISYLESISPEPLPSSEELADLAADYVKGLYFDMDNIYAEVKNILLTPPPVKNERSAKNFIDPPKSDDEIQAEEKKKMQDEFDLLRAKNLSNIRESGILFVHDPALDEPDEEAADFVRELWERPF